MTITRERLLELFDIDLDAGILRWKKSRGNRKAGDIAGNQRKDGYWRIKIDGKDHLLHRIIWFIANGYWPIELDHKDNMSNAITNLREVNRHQNMCNQKIRKNNISGYKGVSWSKQRKKWLVRLDKIQVGYFDCKHEGAKAYNETAIQYYGEYAKLNEVNHE